MAYAGQWQPLTQKVVRQGECRGRGGEEEQRGVYVPPFQE